MNTTLHSGDDDADAIVLDAADIALRARLRVQKAASALSQRAQ